MKKTKKLVSFLLILGTLGVSYASANDESRKVAENYIKEMENFGPFWKGKKPTIVKETPFYTYDDKNVSYMEYKVSCNDDVDCGFVMVNTDRSDVSVPMASTTGKTLSEQMDEKNTGKNKNYYFDVFNHFAITNTGNIKTTSPENKALDNGENIYTRSMDKNPLYEKFKEMQNFSSENKEKYIKNQELKNERQGKTMFRMSTPVSSWNSGLVHNKMIDDKNCRSLTPCYNQLRIRYKDGREGVSGCAATAFSIIYGFYDFHGKTNLIPGTGAPILSHNSGTISNVQQKLAELMKTELNDGGATISKNLQFGFDYLLKKNNSYKDYKYRIHSDARKDVKLIDGNLNGSFDIVKREIWSGRPVLLSYDCGKDCGHIVVVHGFKDNKFLANFGHERDANIIMNIYGNTFTSSEGNGSINFYGAFEILSIWEDII